MQVDDDIVLPIKVYGDVCLRKERRKRQKLLIIEMFYDYARNTSLHGITYITRKGVSLVEKIFWSITFVISVCWCFYLISQVWMKWKASPVIVTVSEHLVPVSKVPFPSVTICPQSKLKVSVYNYTHERKHIINDIVDKHISFRNFEDNVDELFRQRFEKLQALNWVCLRPFMAFNRKKIYNNSSIVQNIQEVSPNHDDIFETCIWRNVTKDCSQILQKVLTREGVCYNFNSLASDEILRNENIQKSFKYLNSHIKSKGWTAEFGYSNDDYKSYPIHGMANGGQPDLIIFLNTNITERDHSCNPYSSGFKIYVHHPTDLPQASLYYYAALENEVSSMALSFNILNTSESLKSYSADVRQCYFHSERYLRYFKIYSESNCRMECLTNATYKRCGCVKFYMPHETENICTTDKWQCTAAAEEEMVYHEANNTNGCHCLPTCNAVEYEAEILKSQYNRRKYYELIGAANIFHTTNLEYSKLEMYYKKPRFISMRRSALYGDVDFLANCGGLLGLFLGFSFLSLVEVFYFLTLRLWCTLKKDREEENAARIDKPEENAVAGEEKKF